MIRLEEELPRFAPIDLKNLEGKLGAIPDDVRTAISMYNKALDDISNHNEDMAVIALRKSISLYPGFYEAMNLMGLCHLALGEEEKARVQFGQVVRMDDSSLRAKAYLDQLDGITPEPADPAHRKRHRGRTGKALPAWLARGLAPERDGPWALKYVAGFLAGLLLMGLLWQIAGKAPLLAFDRNKPELEATLTALQKENQTLQDTLTATSRDLDNANRIQQSLVEEMEAYKQWVTRVAELRTLVAEGKYRDVIRKIAQDYQGLEMPEDIQAQIDAISLETRPKALKQIYDAAVALYKGNAKAQDKTVYQQAMTEFDLAIDILEQLKDKPSYQADLYYLAAKAYWLAGLPNQEEASLHAVEAFQKVIALDAKSSKAKSATSWIKEIEAGRPVKP